MKSVGEVMALGRSFPEALQKAIRMLNTGATGITSHPYEFEHPEREIKAATDRRLYAIYEYLSAGHTVDDTHNLSGIDPWFLHQIERIRRIETELKSADLDHDLMLQAKQVGFADV